MNRPLRILVLHGPNLNMLGLREPEQYGTQTLQDINTAIIGFVSNLSYDVSVDCLQTNHEGSLVERIQQTHPHFGKGIDGIVFNPGAYTHTSIAIRDAILAAGTPVVEVHLSNVYAREEFRHRSMIADVAVGKIVGFGLNSYLLGIEALIRYIVNKNSQ